MTETDPKTGESRFLPINLPTSISLLNLCFIFQIMNPKRLKSKLSIGHPDLMMIIKRVSPIFKITCSRSTKKSKQCKENQQNQTVRLNLICEYALVRVSLYSCILLQTMVPQLTSTTPRQIPFMSPNRANIFIKQMLYLVK